MSDKRNWMLTTATAMVATGRGFDIEEWAASLGAFYDAIVAASGDDGWIEHRGEKPYPEGVVEVRFRDGVVEKFNSDELIWAHDGGPGDIVAWRPAT